jgi:hypothetical protein
MIQEFQEKTRLLKMPGIQEAGKGITGSVNRVTAEHDTEQIFGLDHCCQVLARFIRQSHHKIPKFGKN